MLLSCGKKFPRKGNPWGPICSATKPQRLASLFARPRDLILNGGFPSFVRFPRPIKCSAASSPADVSSIVPGLDLDASIVHGLDASFRSPVSSYSHLSDVTCTVDDYQSLASLSTPMSTSSVADSQLKYDVFISFRGKDSRDNFVSHLYEHLRRAGMETFIDSKKLKAGEEIGPALSNAIERSNISVVVFTKEYATSKSCLRELAKIMECKKSRGQIVLPVFLGVEPTEVRWQTGSYDVAFSKHDKAPEGSTLAEEVKGWRKAMTEAANVSGFNSSAVG